MLDLLHKEIELNLNISGFFVVVKKFCFVP